MVVILYQDGCEKIASQVGTDLAKAFNDRVALKLTPASSPLAWPADPSWDDLMVVIYNANGFPSAGEGFIGDFLQQRREAAMILPVATDQHVSKPPGAAAPIKALKYDSAAEGPGGRLANRVGAMLGLRVQGRDAKMFISYRQLDGAEIAKQLFVHLESIGYRPYLDEAQEVDGETKILPGTPVQQQIDDALSNANLVLLIDTTSAPSSLWIKHEVDTADGLLLPILPICFRDAADPKHGPRFRSLLALQRWVSIQSPAKTASPPLTAEQLDKIANEAEGYLCEIFKRKCRVPFIVEREFVSHGFAWKVLDKRLLMFESSKGQTVRLRTKVLSHCSIFDQIYEPAIRRFGDFLKAAGRHNYSLFIYDGELLPDTQLEELVEAEADPVIILHHQELAALIDSNFTILGKV